MADLRLEAGMGRAVLNRLREFGDLPEDGIVAGQAVASAISELYGEGWGVAYNDVDVFRHYRRLDEDPSRREKREALRVVNTVEFTALEVEIGPWTPYTAMREVVINRNSKYSVVKTTRDEMVNTVYYDHGRATADASFLSTFDINAGQVGVDIETKQLVWTPEFERYLKTRQLEIVTLHTPYQSLIRYFKKRDELEGTYGNDARMTEMIGLAYAMATSPQAGFNPQEDISLRWRFGPTIAQKLDKVRRQVTDHFEVVSETVSRLELFQLVPRFEVDRDLLKLVRRQADVAHLVPRLSRTLREARKKSFMARAEYVTETTIVLDGRPENTPHISQVLWLQRGDAVLEERDVTVEALKRLDDFVFWNDLNGFFLGRSYTRSLAIKRQIERAIEERGWWIRPALGLLTNENPNEAFNDDDWLIGFVGREEDRMREHVIERILPDGFMPDLPVVELFDREALLQEGELMHHCVGGYSELLPEGYARFFSIRPSKDRETWLTLYLKVQFEGERGCATGWKVSQVKGLCNRSPTEAEDVQIAEFLERFNDFYIDEVCGGAWKLLDVSTRWALAFTPMYERNSWTSLMTRVLQLVCKLPTHWEDVKGKRVFPGSGLQYWPPFFKWKLQQFRKTVSDRVARLRAWLVEAGTVGDEEAEEVLR